MKRIWLVVPVLALGFAGGVGRAAAAEAPKEKAKMEKPAKPVVLKLPQRLQTQFETTLGKPLTEDQIKLLAQEEYDFKAAYDALRLAHRAKQAQLLGITVEQMDAADVAARKKMMDERQNKASATEAPAAAPATATGADGPPR